MKQNKCTTIMPLDKTRIWLDFNEFCAIAKSEKALTRLPEPCLKAREA